VLIQYSVNVVESEGGADFSFTYLSDGEWRRGGPGTFFSASRGVEHGFRNPGRGRIRVLNIHAPNTGFVEGMRGLLKHPNCLQR
jgi:mannose-6-phosphate isomerase-like protein (cupin superfamily)